MKNVDFLRENGFDIESAMGYLGDMETFDEILRDFYDGLDAQLIELESVKSDMPNYAILVHALKSNCRTLGITYYVEVAYQHELESKANNSTFVNENFDELIVLKEKTKKIIEEYLGL